MSADVAGRTSTGSAWGKGGSHGARRGPGAARSWPAGGGGDGRGSPRPGRPRDRRSRRRAGRSGSSASIPGPVEHRSGGHIGGEQLATTSSAGGSRSRRRRDPGAPALAGLKPRSPTSARPSTSQSDRQKWSSVSTPRARWRRRRPRRCRSRERPPTGPVPVGASSSPRSRWRGRRSSRRRCARPRRCGAPDERGADREGGRHPAGEVGDGTADTTGCAPSGASTPAHAW